MIPQIAVLALMAVSLILGANLHGKPQRPHSFWSHLRGVALMFALLYLGGFFAGWGWAP